MIKKIIKSVYHEMQQHYPTFRVLVWLKEKGITRRVNFLISHNDDEEYRRHPSEAMLKSQAYFTENAERINRVKEMLADEKSRQVLDACLNYRMYRTPIPEDLYSEHDQYFTDVIQLQDNEVFVDGGGYTGDTIQQLLDTARRENVSVKRIVTFEPDVKNCSLLKRFFEKRANITIYQKGLSDKESTLFFKEAGVGSRIVEDAESATSQINVIDIDSVPECIDATYIKMDIEGAEWESLHGAEATIERNRPKLAICIYHSDEDMIRLVEYIKGIIPDYRLFVRHHSKCDVETVVYAVFGRNGFI